MCHACRAMVHQMQHKLKASPSRDAHARAAHVLEQLESICEMSNLKIYEYAPPKMSKACAHFLEQHSGERAQSPLRHQPSSVLCARAEPLTRRASGCRRSCPSGDELEALLGKGGERQGMSDEICLGLTGVCEGIAWSAPTGVPGYDEYVPPEPRAAPAPPAGRRAKRARRGSVRREQGDAVPMGDHKEEV